MTEPASTKLTSQDYNDIWYLVDYYGSKMWPADRVQQLRTLLKSAEKSAAK